MFCCWADEVRSRFVSLGKYNGGRCGLLLDRFNKSRFGCWDQFVCWPLKKEVHLVVGQMQ